MQTLDQSSGVRPPPSDFRPPTYPARPINGGPLSVARPKPGRRSLSPESQWFYEPKYNGWRAMVHVPTGAMFNRHNEPLTIQSEFSEALVYLRRLSYEWLDCEALDRRHNVGRGALIVLDSPSLADLTYVRRRNILERDFLMISRQSVPEDNGVYLPMSMAIGDYQEAFWNVLRRDNAEIKHRCHLTEDFFEGTVAKLGSSVYPIQLRSAKEEFAGWMKHRWTF